MVDDDESPLPVAAAISCCALQQAFLFVCPQVVSPEGGPCILPQPPQGLGIGNNFKWLRGLRRQSSTQQQDNACSSSSSSNAAAAAAMLLLLREGDN